MFIYLLLAFIFIPAFELYLLIQVGAKIGALNTMTLVVFTGIVGAYFARKEGLKVVFLLKGEMKKGKVPAIELIQGLMILLGGILLLTPGIVTDIIGFTMVLPITRPFISKLILKMLKDYAVKSLKNIAVKKQKENVQKYSLEDDGTINIKVNSDDKDDNTGKESDVKVEKYDDSGEDDSKIINLFEKK